MTHPNNRTPILSMLCLDWDTARFDVTPARTTMRTPSTCLPITRESVTGKTGGESKIA